ncbi:MAG: aspartyl protease family protein [Bacteroidota bacterium]|nr:aspartyl protease family protein [Bacteroidota bacterium]
MKQLRLLCLCLCVVAQLHAQTTPPVGKTFAQSLPTPMASFGFIQLSGGIIILKAALDSLPDSLNFILDTGSGGISLDSATVDEFHLDRVHTDRTIRGIAGIKTVDFTYGHRLQFPGFTLDSLDFHINNYDLLTSVYGVKIDGIIGYTFFSRYVVSVDYDTHTLGIYPKGAFKYPKGNGGYMLHPRFSSLVYQPVTITDARKILSRFIFDTGAGLCFLVSEQFLKDSSLLKTKRKMYPTQAEGLGGKKEMQLTVTEKIKIGPYQFRRVPLLIFSDDYNITSYPFLGGILGNDIMRRFNTVFNYAEKSIYIVPNHHFFDPFDYSYTGLGIYWVDGAVKVIDVMPGSPGDKAGFLPDDIIVAMNNVFTQNIQTFKNLLQNAGSRVKVIVQRNGTLETLDLKIVNILRR